MFLIWGFGHQTTKDYGVDRSNRCGHCNNMVERRFLRITTWFTLFFIPIIPYRRQYAIVCPICNDIIILSKEEFMDGVAGYGEYIIGDDRTEVAQTDRRYIGKTETQVAYLKQMEELEKEKEQSERS